MRRLGLELKDLATGPASGVLATLVRTEGHTYRKAGAQMLVHASGRTQGLLSGGCLEDLIAGEARGVLAAGVPKVVTYDLMGEEEYLVGYGKGCLGKLWILLEPVTPALDAARRAMLVRLGEATTAAGVAVVYEGPDELLGRRVIVPAGEDCGLAPLALEARAALSSGRSSHGELVLDGARVSYAAFSQPAAQDLVVFGAGPDAEPLARIAAELGWDVRLYDHRPSRIASGRFPAGATLALYRPDAVGDAVTLKPASAVVIMTHNLLVDLALLRWLARQPVASYVGLLGPAHRRERLFALAGEDGDDLAEGLGVRLHSPIGLDLGGGSEADIALAVVAEIQKWRHTATGESRRLPAVEPSVAPVPCDLAMPGRAS